MAARLAIGITIALAALGVSAPVAAGQPAGDLAGEEVVRRLAAGQTVDLRGVTVTGDVDLTPLGMVTRPLRCQDCRLVGALRAPDVVFQRTLDLSGSTLSGPADLRGATFEDLARFDGTELLAEADFTAARFAGDAAFTRGSFRTGASFAAATFAERADFTRRCFAGCERPPSCDGAPGADGGVDFSGASFSGEASFVLARFADQARLRGVELGGGARFLGACLNEGLDLSLSTNDGTLNFNGALASGVVDLSNVVSSGSLSLAGLRALDVPGESGRVRTLSLAMEQLSASSLSMEVSTVGHVLGPDVQEEILALIEETAQADDNLALANDARYERLVRQERDGEWRLADLVLYRGVAGYLVRPSHPLIAFLAILALATLVRIARRGPAATPTGTGTGTEDPSHPIRRRVLAAEQAVTVVFASVAASLSVAFRPTLRDAGHPEADRVGSYLVVAARWAEFLAYKVLLAVLLLTLANSYVAVRQIIDAV